MLENILRGLRAGWEIARGAPWFWFAVVFLIQRYVPGADKIFKAAYVTLDEIDRITDAILEEFPDLEHVQTVDDVVNEVKKILARHYDKIPAGKVENEVQKQILNQPNGFSTDADGNLKFNMGFQRKF